MKLIITEKPSVARDIAKVLGAKQQNQGFISGSNVIITWALGHLIELCQPDEYHDALKKWDMATLPIIPDSFKTKVIQRSAEQFEVVKQLCVKPELNEVVCATDAGREGELIFRLIYEESKCELPIQRLWISSQTETAIKEGFENLKPGKDYEPLYDSAKSRSEADWLVGINATRAYSIKFSRGHGVMSVGRVQTPVLKLIVDRYREHIQFKSAVFFELLATIKHANGSFQAQYSGEKSDRFTSKEDAETIKKAIESNKNGKIEKLTEKKITEKQPLLYDLTEAQKDANKQFKYSADDTLKHLQSLYEKHKILSYPRTSSRYLSKDLAPKLPGLLTKIAQVPQVKETIKDIQIKKRTIASRMVDDKKVTDHHAIIPTDKQPNIALLTAEELNIYTMIIKRFVAAFMPECLKDHTEIIAQFGMHQLKATGTVIKQAGWRELYSDDGGASKSKKQAEVQLPIVNENDDITHSKVTLKKGQTKAPPLYTEASILAAMETAGKTIDDEELRQAMKYCGLGTPATRAQILEKLIHVKYILREKNKLIPTDKGQYLIDCIQDPVMQSPELTGEWEKQLNQMAQGSYARDKFMNDIQEFTTSITQKVADSETVAIRADQTILGDCPLCEKGKVVGTPKAYGCSQWKETNCKFVIWKEIAKKPISESMVKTLLTKEKTSVIKGFKSKAGKPFNAALKLNEGRVEFEFEQTFVGACPLCEGAVTETLKAYSCSKWRETGCKFVVWKEIAKRKITLNEAKSLLLNGKLDTLEGFKSNQGKAFSAKLAIEKGRVVLV